MCNQLILKGCGKMFKLHVANYSLRGMSNLNFSNNEMAALLCVGTQNDSYYHFYLYEILSKHIQTLDILVVTEWTIISIHSMFLAMSQAQWLWKILIKMRNTCAYEWYCQFSGKHGNLMIFCFCVSRLAKVTAIIEWPRYIHNTWTVSESRDLWDQTPRSKSLDFGQT